MEDVVSERAGDWMQTFSGRKFWPIDPRADEVHIEDIAHALSLMCRFNGHCTKFYSVAEHSVYVSRACDQRDALWGLLHDAAEAYVADIVRPAKRFIAGYADVEARIMLAVTARFNLPAEMPDSVRRADDAILADEMAQITRHNGEWLLREPPTGRPINCYSPFIAKQVFLNRFEILTR